MGGSEADALELQLKIKVDGQEALKSTTDGTKAVGGAAAKAAKDVDSYVKALERQASLAGKTADEQMKLKRSFALEDFGKNEQQVKRINQAFDQLGRSIEKPRVEIQQTKTKLHEFAEQSEEKFRNLGGSLGSALNNPLQALQGGAAGLLRYLGPGGMIAAGAAAGIGIIAKEAMSMARSLAEGARETVQFGERLGITAGQARELQKQAQLAGVNVFSLEGSARILAAALEDTSGQGAKASKVLQKLGIDSRAYGGDAREMGDVLLEVVDKLSLINNQTDLVRNATLLLGRGSKEILPLIKNYQEYKRTLSELGVMMDSGVIEKTAKTAEEFHKLDIAWEELMRSFKQKISPIVVPVVIKLTGLMTGKNSASAGVDESNARVDNGEQTLAGNGFSIEALRNGVLQMISPLAPFDLRRALTHNSPFNYPPSGSEADGGIKQEQDRAVAAAKKFRDTAIAQDAETIKARVEKLKQENKDLYGQLSSDKLLSSDRSEKEKQFAANNKEIDQLEKRAKVIEGMPQLIEAMRQKAVEAETKQSTGLEQINAQYEKEIEHLKQIGSLTPATRGLAARVRDAEIAKFNRQVSAEKTSQTRRSAGEVENVASSYARTVAGTFDEAYVRETQGPGAAIDQSFTNKVGGAGAEFSAASRRVNAMRQESTAREALMHDQIALEKELGAIRVEEIKAAGKYAEDYYKASFDKTKALQALEIDRLRTNREIENVRLSMEKTSAQQGFTRGSRLAAIDPDRGAEVTSIRREYDERIRLAGRLAQIEFERIAVEKDENKKRLDAANLEKDLEQQITEAAIDREVKLAELQHKRLEEARNEAGKLASGILGGRSGLKSFVTDQVKDLAHGVLQNILTPIIKSAQDHLAKTIPGQRDASGKLTPLGKILQGTILGARETPELKAQKDTIAAVQTSNEFLQQIRDMLAGATGGYTPASSGAGGMGGYTPIGSGTAGGGISATLGSVARASTATNAPGWLKSAGSFLGGALSGPIGGIGSVIKGFSDPNVSWSEWAGKAVGLGAAVGAGVFESINNFRQGGARGIIGGIGSVAGTAAMLDPEPISRTVLSVIATAGTVIKSLFGDPRELRQRRLNDTLERDTYRAPLSQNITQGMNGTYQDFDARGNLRSTGYRAMPSMLEPFASEMHLNGQYSWYDYPGATGRPFQTGASGAPGPMPVGNTYHISINTLDPGNFHDYLQRNASSVGEALATHLQNHDGRAAAAIRFVAGRDN
jgi:hypothetical protein